jgi:Zn-dependent protease/predicted transcriptional regulator
MKGSWKIAQVAGIGIFVHWTLAILLAFFAVQFFVGGRGNLAIVFHGMALIAAVFLCIVLHELGHALAAKRYGIQTRDITLLPIGGLARLERIPEQPQQELVIALAGPAVNVVIAGILVVTILLIGGLPNLAALADAENGITLLYIKEGVVHFLANLAWFNVVLVLFNLLPAFPMDGGRVLRALLAFRLPYPIATQRAASIGRGMAVLFAVFGLFSGHWPLLLIALFIYIAGEAESQFVQTKALLQGVPVRQAMITHFVTLSPRDRLAVAVEALLAGYQQDFPVVHDGIVVGLLTRTDLVRALAEGSPEQPVESIMRRNCALVGEDEPLEVAFLRLQENECSTLPVARQGRLVGVLTLENVGEWLMVQTALGEQSQHRLRPTNVAA